MGKIMQKKKKWRSLTRLEDQQGKVLKIFQSLKKRMMINKMGTKAKNSKAKAKRAINLKNWSPQRVKKDQENLRTRRSTQQNLKEKSIWLVHLLNRQRSQRNRLGRELPLSNLRVH